ncbi:MAG TPA: ABC transporter ATP-binding protein [Solirubrobacteraceae bacterium]|jgi:ABC-type lipoprotein export system ATPase subunit|nr:ABC transporter ATP-binding protein [Solirubrobacteraceae bacterium]
MPQSSPQAVRAPSAVAYTPEPDPQPATYELSGVSKVYGSGSTAVRALDGIGLTIARGEFVAIIGASGSGKTTLLQLLGALDRASDGRTLLNGRDLQTLDERELTRLRRDTIGFVFQQFNLVPTLTAGGNIEAAIATTKQDGRQRAERVAELLEIVGLAGRADHLPSQLSGGEQQRVAIARALANGPSVLLADEPTGNLDSATGDEILRELKRLVADRGLTLVLITHDAKVASAALRTIRLRDGRIVEGSN